MVGLVHLLRHLFLVPYVNFEPFLFDFALSVFDFLILDNNGISLE